MGAEGFRETRCGFGEEGTSALIPSIRVIPCDALLRSRAGGRASWGRAANTARFALQGLTPDTQLAKSAARVTCASLS
jgi:hypothetical protein